MSLVVKKQKTSTDVVVREEDSKKQVAIAQPKRTSGLAAPNMQLTGHKLDITSIEFSPSGTTLATGSKDKTIGLWNTYGEELENYMQLSGHTNAVLQVKYHFDGKVLVSASADKTASIWNLEDGVRIRRCKGHTSNVNTCALSKKGVDVMLTGSDDWTTRVWDMRSKNPQHTINCQAPVLAVTFSDHGDQFFTGGLDNVIKAFDTRKPVDPLYVMKGHVDSVTGLELSPDGSFLLSNSMDNSVRMWDVRPYAPTNRCLKTFRGHQHNFEKNLLRCAWSSDGRQISAGSADRFVYVWNVNSTKIMYKLPGHKGSVNDVAFHPSEPIIASASSDATAFLGEIQPAKV
eukprot:GCRY01002378.1.p1 GENE.GCRY01002378.1~~GCRY01002378.1.p1  ORF type:complete len:345 (+),score=50.83 GCRY01002378.1:175-1209(+)